MGKSPAGVDIFGQCEYNNDENKEGILRGRVLKESAGMLYFRGFFEEIKLFGDNLVTF